MSSLWTPGGEHRVPPSRDEPTGRGVRATGPADDDPDDDLDDVDELDDGTDEAELAQAAAEMQAEIDAARRRVAGAPAADVVANHAMGLFELAAIHLSTQPPHLADASLAIDALGALVDGVGDRLGEAGPTLREALTQLRLAFVQVKSSST
jgi:hypothetical protein